MSSTKHILESLEASHETMVKQTVAWANINSGSHHVAGLARMREALAAAFGDLGGTTETLELAPMQEVDDAGNIKQVELGKALRFRKRPDAPMQVFLGGHMDTVFGEKHPFQKTVQKEHILNGPGVADLKGGLVVMLHALLTLEKSDAAKNIGWEVLINPDEEIGSLGSGPLFKEAAARNLLGMVYEPALDNGGFAGERKGSGNFTVVMQGRAAHAGRDFAKGRNAIVALSEYVTRVNALNGTREGVTINPGVIRGGAATNIVPDMAVMRFNVRTSVMDDQVWMEAQLDEIAKNFAGREGFSHRIYGGFTRAPKKLDAKHLALYEAMKSTGETLGLKLGWQPTGGACDGNNLSAAGLPNIDTLGVRGGALHSDSEWMDTGSLVERARLSAAFLQRLAVGDVKL